MALNAAFFQDVTMFQPTRPPVKWSRVDNLLASRKGGSNEVDAVMAKVKFLVTAAMALIGYWTTLALLFSSLGSGREIEKIK